MRKHVNDAVEVGIKRIEHSPENLRNRIFGSTPVRLSPCTRVDLEDSSPSEVCPVPHTRVQSAGRFETCLEGGNDQIEWRVVIGVAIEPSDGSCKTHSRVNGFGISDILENPTNTARIIRILFPKGFQVLYVY